MYGIILITLSVIGLSGQAFIGQLLSAGFGLVLGKAYAIIPVLGIYIGLYLMIRRALPYGWSTRKSGLLLVSLSGVLMLSIAEAQSHIQLQGQMTASGILSAVQNDLYISLIAPDTQMSQITPFLRPIGGGYLGALVLSLLYWMVGLTGAKLASAVLLIIGLMLITQMSYVDMMNAIRRKAGEAARSAGERMKEDRLAAEERKLEAAQKNEIRAQEKAQLQEQRRLVREEKRQALSEQNGNTTEDDFTAKEEYKRPVAVAKSKTEFSDLPVEVVTPEVSPVPTPDSAYAAPIIRDFFEHIRSEKSRQSEATIPDVDDDAEDFEEVGSELIPAVAAVEGAATSDNDISELPIDPSIPAAAGELAEVPITPPPKPYKLPPLKLLALPKPDENASANQADYMQTARKLESTLESFGVRARVLEVVRGPAVTRYEIQPDVGVKVSRVVGLTDDIALALAAKDIRMEAPIPGKSAIGIEVPNNEVSMVTMREVMDTSVFADAASKLTVAFGRDISGQTIVGNLARMPHLLVAGATGSGKSVCINGIIASILYKAKPDEVKFLMVDPKMVELNIYNGIPHLLAPVVTDPRRASLALKKIVVEMEKRYELFSKSATRNIEGYNTLMKDNPSAVLPYIVVIVDELADLMMVAAGDVEDAIARLAQMARAAGIHLIIATQRPSVDVITGVIKANIPSRIAFGVSSQVDSRTILDMGGAEKLLGRGDMLFMPMGASKPVRVQGAFLSDNEVEEIVAYCSGQAEAQYDTDLVPEIDDTALEPEEALDELYDQAVQIVVEAKQASVSLLQRRMRVGYTRAARLVDSMEARGIVGPYEGSKPREVLISIEQWQASRAATS
ncbi:DNA translocase FtsK [Saccharibacillus sp. JS10]|uniref:FtsK/SpoIIIE family DNA translocase n=1 Tax=Saccharibacillus sp. JS10 TaxID=2950552 RepID=UPI0035224201